MYQKWWSLTTCYAGGNVLGTYTSSSYFHISWFLSSSKVNLLLYTSTLAAVPGSPQSTPWGTVCQPNSRSCFFNTSFLKNLAFGNCIWDWGRLSSFQISLRLKWDVYFLTLGYVFTHLRWVSCFSLGVAAQQLPSFWSKYCGSHHEPPSLPKGSGWRRSKSSGESGLENVQIRSKL